MFCNDYSASDYQKNHRKFSCNAYWVTIRQDGKVIYKREATNNKWYDESHRRITEALSALESAILEAPIEEQ